MVFELSATGSQAHMPPPSMSLLVPESLTCLLSGFFCLCHNGNSVQICVSPSPWVNHLLCSVSFPCFYSGQPYLCMDHRKETRLVLRLWTTQGFRFLFDLVRHPDSDPLHSLDFHLKVDIELWPCIQFISVLMLYLQPAKKHECQTPPVFSGVSN